MSIHLNSNQWFVNGSLWWIWKLCFVIKEIYFSSSVSAPRDPAWIEAGCLELQQPSYDYWEKVKKIAEMLPLTLSCSDTELLRQQRVPSYIMTPCYVRKINYFFKALLAVLLITGYKKNWCRRMFKTMSLKYPD